MPEVTVSGNPQLEFGAILGLSRGDLNPQPLASRARAIPLLQTGPSVKLLVAGVLHVALLTIEQSARAAFGPATLAKSCRRQRCTKPACLTCTMSKVGSTSVAFAPVAQSVSAPYL